MSMAEIDLVSRVVGPPGGYGAGGGGQVCAIASDSVNVPDVIGMGIAPFSEYVSHSGLSPFSLPTTWNPVKTIAISSIFAILSNSEP